MTKSQILKKIIKEAVIEALHDELRTIIREELQNMKPLLSNPVTSPPKKKVNFQDFLPGRRPMTQNQPQKSGNALLAENLKGNPLAAFIQDTASKLTTDEMNNMVSGNGVSAEPSMTMSAQDLGEIEDYTPSNMPDFTL